MMEARQMMNFCPRCGEDLTKWGVAVDKPATEAAIHEQAKPYDQVAVWKKLLTQAAERQTEGSGRLSPEQLVSRAVTLRNSVATYPQQSIVHIVFDRPVTPKGGLLNEIAQFEGRGKVSPEYLESMGYVLDNDKVMMVDDVPVGAVYNLIKYWGGEKQYKRWHLHEPVTLEPSRNGDPFFMDNNMVAFGAKWANSIKWSEALITLLEYFTQGVDASDKVETAIPLVLHVVWQ
jgi:hypothetical protein